MNKIDIEDFRDEEDESLEVNCLDGIDEDLLSRSPSKNGDDAQYTFLKKRRKCRLTCIDYNFLAQNIVFYFESIDYHYGKCFVAKEVAKKECECCLCGDKIKPGNRSYFPISWDMRLTTYKICKKCFFDSVYAFIYD